MLSGSSSDPVVCERVCRAEVQQERGAVISQRVGSRRRTPPASSPRAIEGSGNTARQGRARGGNALNFETGPREGDEDTRLQLQHTPLPLSLSTSLSLSLHGTPLVSKPGPLSSSRLTALVALRSFAHPSPPSLPFVFCSPLLHTATAPSLTAWLPLPTGDYQWLPVALLLLPEPHSTCNSGAALLRASRTRQTCFVSLFPTSARTRLRAQRPRPLSLRRPGAVARSPAQVLRFCSSSGTSMLNRRRTVLLPRLPHLLAQPASRASKRGVR